jgi:hypothetical protein
MAAWFLLGAAAICAQGCSASSERNAGAGGSSSVASSVAASSATGVTPPTGARFTGTVWGPHADGKPSIFPVPGAAVIAQVNPPEPIPACNTCVEIPEGSYHTLSAADGSFTLDVPSGATVHFIVQKGQFRRSRLVTAPQDPGVYPVHEDNTTLPHVTDVALGDVIPRIALAYGDYDHIEDVLAKVGIGTEDPAYGHQWGSEAGHFDVYNNAGPGEPAHGENLMNLIMDPARLASYDVILFPCSYNANFGFMNNATVQQNLKDYVWNGGKLYVADYAMPVAEMPWPEFAWFTDPLHGGCTENQFPPNCNHGPPFDAPATPGDPDLSAWLDAMGMLQGLQVKENWDTIGETFPGNVGQDPMTMQTIYEKPKVWVEGPWSYSDKDLMDLGIDPATWDQSPHPFTLSWRYNCGRVLFTTYHTVGSTTGGKHPGLLPQERILFYLLMEMTVCQSNPVIK